jgi:hypothetical protein
MNTLSISSNIPRVQTRAPEGSPAEERQETAVEKAREVSQPASLPPHLGQNVNQTA